MSFPSPDGAVISRWGFLVTHFGDTSQTEVRVVRADDLPELAPNVLHVLFGTMTDSGFVDYPKKGDYIEMDSERFRVYDVKSDRPGGTLATDGLWLHLTFDDEQ